MKDYAAVKGIEIDAKDGDRCQHLRKQLREWFPEIPWR